jgi:hypothetical protein
VGPRLELGERIDEKFVDKLRYVCKDDIVEVLIHTRLN